MSYSEEARCKAAEQIFAMRKPKPVRFIVATPDGGVDLDTYEHAIDLQGRLNESLDLLRKLRNTLCVYGKMVHIDYDALTAIDQEAARILAGKQP